ncbi:MAG: hypothetical protein EP332_07170 [Bacteroidetes bacterium]|nr:MAG: hypothetical protein EP332_07170 [Bacteroidota bacterium]
MKILFPILLLGFLFSACQQRYWHVKKVKAHPVYEVREERKELQKTASLSTKPDSTEVKIAFQEPHFPAEAIATGNNENTPSESVAEEAELKTQIEEAENHDAITLTDDDEEDENQVEALEYIVLFAFFFTALLVALIALYFPAVFLALLFGNLSFTTTLGYYVAIFLGALFTAAFLFLAYRIYRFFVRYSFPKKIDQSLINKTFIFFIAFLVLAIGYPILYLLDSIIIGIALGILSFVLPLITVIYFIKAWLK